MVQGLIMRAISAYTTYPNTPESDKQRLVMHTVTFANGLRVKLLAECPMHAIEIANDNIKNGYTMVLEPV
jgi:hypothetical protein